MAKKYESFLGANTPRGFVSLFDELYNPYHDCSAFIIKGGPGTGKSTFMKKLAVAAEKNDLDTEWIYCSSDPASLDGLIIPEKNICVADGTSPHIIEPKFPGAVENIINTGDFWDREKLHSKQDEIRALTLENSMCHRRASRYISAAGSVNEESLRLTESYADKDKINGFALRFASRELPDKKTGRPGRRIRRFISAITPEGLVFLDSTVKTLASRIIGIDDEFSLISCALVDRIGEIAVRNGYDVIFCHCPMKPSMQCEHIIIPEMKLALVTVKSSHNSELECDRLIHVRRFFKADIERFGCTLRLNRKLIRELIAQAVFSLQGAKQVHDRLEKIYVEAMDFPSLEIYCENIIKKLL